MPTECSTLLQAYNPAFDESVRTTVFAASFTTKCSTLDSTDCSTLSATYKPAKRSALFAAFERAFYATLESTI